MAMIDGPGTIKTDREVLEQVYNEYVGMDVTNLTTAEYRSVLKISTQLTGRATIPVDKSNQVKRIEKNDFVKTG